MADITCDRCGLDLEAARHGATIHGLKNLSCDNCGCLTGEDTVKCFYIGEDGEGKNTAHQFYRFKSITCAGCGVPIMGLRLFCGGIDVTDEIVSVEKVKENAHEL